MKKLIFFAVIISILTIYNKTSYSQNDSVKTVKIKIIKEVDGVTTITDTTYEVSADEAEPEIVISNNSAGKTGSANSSANKTVSTTNSYNQTTDIVTELGNAFNAIAASLPVIDSYVDENGMEVYMLRNLGTTEIELMKKCNNSIYIDNEEIVIPSIKFTEGEYGTDVLIVKKKCGSEVEVEKIKFPKITSPVIDIVETDGGKQVMIINDEKYSKNEDDEIQTIFGNKEEKSIDNLEDDMDKIESSEVENNSKTDEIEEINEDENETASITLVESNDLQLKRLNDKNIDTELNENIENLAVEDFTITNLLENKKISVSFSLPEKDEITLKIYDIDGNLLITDNVTKFKGTYSKELNFDYDKEGIFYIQVIQGKKIETRHFIVSK